MKESSDTEISGTDHTIHVFAPQVVRTVVVVLHRQWLKTKGRGSQTVGNRSWTSPGLQVLREALMLLHWLLLKDSSFSEHCLEVLHMYDQVIPAIRDTLRLVPDLSESEGGFVSLHSIIVIDADVILISLNICFSTFKGVVYPKISSFCHHVLTLKQF